MRVDEVRALTDQGLIERRNEMKEEAMRMRFALATNQQTNSAQMRSLKRDIARINTIMREREIAEAFQQALGTGVISSQ
jgi:large subunit ribosomal protein L29